MHSALRHTPLSTHIYYPSQDYHTVTTIAEGLKEIGDRLHYTDMRMENGIW